MTETCTYTLTISRLFHSFIFGETLHFPPSCHCPTQLYKMLWIKAFFQYSNVRSSHFFHRPAKEWKWIFIFKIRHSVAKVWIQNRFQFAQCQKQIWLMVLWCPEEIKGDTQAEIEKHFSFSSFDHRTRPIGPNGSTAAAWNPLTM